MGGVRLKILNVPFPVFILELWRVVVFVFRLVLLIPKSLVAVEDYLFENYTPPSNVLLFLMGVSCAALIFTFVMDNPNFEWVKGSNGRYYYVEITPQKFSVNIEIKIIEKAKVTDYGVEWFEQAIVVTTEGQK